jgi:hypothetical protein
MFLTLSPQPFKFVMARRNDVAITEAGKRRALFEPFSVMAIRQRTDRHDMVGFRFGQIPAFTCFFE